MNSEKKILVTGAAGFIGSHLAERLIADDFKVCALIKPTTNLSRIHSLLPKLELCHANLLNFDELKATLDKIRPQGIFHLAASNIMSGVTAPDEDVINTNILGLRNLLTAAESIDYNFFVNIGSFLEYGPKSHPVKEDEVCCPTELYSITKLAASLYGQAMAINQNRPIVTFRLFTPYGPAIQPGRLIYEYVTRALKNQEINLTKPKVTRDFIFVKDLVDLLMEAAAKARDYKGQIFNAGSGESVSLENVANMVLKITGSKSNINWGSFSNQIYDSEIWQADLNKTKSHFKWRPSHSLEAGLTQTVNWFKENS